MLLNTREIAILCWGIAFIIYVLVIVNKKKWINFLKAAFAFQLMRIHIVSILYVCLTIFIIYLLRLWDTGQLKNTLTWFFTAGLVAIFNANSDKNGSYFKETMKDVLSFTVITEFFAGFYTFNIFIELVLVPLVAIIGAMLTYTKLKNDYKDVSKLLSNLLSLLGICLIGYAIYQLTQNFSAFATKETLQDFLVPMLLSILFIPYIYALSLFVIYQYTFTSLINTIKPATLFSYAKRKAMIHFHFNLKDLDRWKNTLFSISVETKKDIDNSIRQIKLQKKLEANPPVVAADKGWSPYLATDFLAAAGLSAENYQHNYGDEWFACSKHKIMGSNNIAYYIEGDQLVAKQLQLVATIVSPDAAPDVLAHMLNYSIVLYYAAINKKLPGDIQQAILSTKNIDFKEGLLNVSVKKNSWPDNPRKGYNLDFTVRLVGQ